MHYVYILYSSSLDKYYVGQSSDIASRLRFHNDKIFNKIWTSRGIPWELKLQIECSDRSEAVIIERYIKRRKSRIYVETLISEGWSGFPESSGES